MRHINSVLLLLLLLLCCCPALHAGTAQRLVVLIQHSNDHARQAWT
jgi:hypothetical protein